VKKVDMINSSRMMENGMTNFLAKKKNTAFINAKKTLPKR